MNTRISLFLIALCFTGCSGESEEFKKFDSEPGYLALEGMYDVNYEFGDSDCEPHLDSLKYSGQPSWPTNVSLARKPGDFPDGYLGLRFENIRDQGLGFNIISERDPEGRFVIKSLGTQKDALVEAVDCADGTDETLSGYAVSTAYSVADNVIRVNTTNTFDLSNECEGVRPQGTFWFPKESCSESYVTTYTLRESCPQRCEVKIPWESVESPEGAYYRTMDVNQPWCICPE